MYTKKYRLESNKHVIDIKEIYKKLKESEFILQIDRIKSGFYGIDKENNFFVLKYDDSVTYLAITLEVENFMLMNKISEIIEGEDDSIKGEFESQLTLINKMIDDISTIKGIMIFYLILTILGFFFSIFIR